MPTPSRGERRCAVGFSGLACEPAERLTRAESRQHAPRAVYRLSPARVVLSLARLETAGGAFAVGRRDRQRIDSRALRPGQRPSDPPATYPRENAVRGDRTASASGVIQNSTQCVLSRLDRYARRLSCVNREFAERTARSPTCCEGRKKERRPGSTRPDRRSKRKHRAESEIPPTQGEPLTHSTCHASTFFSRFAGVI